MVHFWMGKNTDKPTSSGQTAKAALAVSESVKAGTVFKTKPFTRDASAAGISDRDLYQAIREVQLGQADDLGGGVWKKRLSNNAFRSIILAKGGKHWIYAYLFSKSSRANIRQDELQAFKDLAKLYCGLSDAELKKVISAGKLVEVCDDRKQKES